MYDDDHSRENLLNAYSSEVSKPPLKPLFYELFNLFQAVFSLSVVTSERMK